MHNTGVAQINAMKLLEEMDPWQEDNAQYGCGTDQRCEASRRDGSMARSLYAARQERSQDKPGYEDIDMLLF